MSTRPLPRQADIRKLASSGTVLEGSIALARLERVAQALADESGAVIYRLEFSVSEEGIFIIDGALDAVVRVQCQRCLETMELPLSSRFLLGAVWDDERARNLPKRMEPLLVDDEEVDTLEVIEDELLLCLPFVAYHAPDECPREVGYRCGEVQGDAAQEPKKNPFDALAALKKPKV
jgi:uncharacterized protein